MCLFESASTRPSESHLGDLCSRSALLSVHTLSKKGVFDLNNIILPSIYYPSIMQGGHLVVILLSHGIIKIVTIYSIWYEMLR